MNPPPSTKEYYKQAAVTQPLEKVRSKFNHFMSKINFNIYPTSLRQNYRDTDIHTLHMLKLLLLSA